VAIYRRVEDVDLSAFDVNKVYDWVFYTSPAQDDIYVENEVTGDLFELFVGDEPWEDVADLHSLFVDADDEC